MQELQRGAGAQKETEEEVESQQKEETLALIIFLT